MSDNLDEFTKEAPVLTLDPFEGKKAEEAPVLTAEADKSANLEITPAVNTPSVKEGAAEEAPKSEIDESMLSDTEKQQIDKFVDQIDISDSNVVLQYGAGAQKKMADFSDKALECVRTKDLGDTGDLLANVVTELKNFDADEEGGGIFGFFKKQKNKLELMKTRYDKAETNVNKICDTLEEHQVTLMKDSAMLDNMYELNLTYFKELTMYIIAGKKKLEQVRTVTLKELSEKAS